MSQIVQPSEPAPRPVGPAGTRVEIRERSREVSSMVGSGSSPSLRASWSYGFSRRALLKVFIVIPIVLAVIIFSSLVIVQPGQTRVVQFFGSYVGTVRHTGLSWIIPLTNHRA